MKIVIISPSDWGPRYIVPVRIFPLAKTLSDQNHEVTILLPPKGTPYTKQSKFELEGVEIIRVLPRLPTLIGGDFLSALFLAGRALAIGPDIVHIFRPVPPSGLAGVIINRLSRVPIIVDVDEWEGSSGIGGKERPRWIRPLIDRQLGTLLQLADAITTGTPNLRRRIAKDFAKDRVFILEDGPAVAPQAVIEFSEKEELSPAATYLGYAPLEYHDLDILIYASINLNERSRECLFRVVGRGPGLLELSKEVSKRGLDEHFHIVSTAENAEWERPERALAAASILLYPCRSNLIREMRSASPVITYLAAGKPIVASDVAPVAHVLNRNRRTPVGRLVKVDDVDDALIIGRRFADGLEEIMASPRRARRLGRRAKGAVVGYLWGERKVEIDRMYRTILGWRDQDIMLVRALRLGSVLGGIGFLIGVTLLAFEIPVGIVVLFGTLGIVGLSLYAFWLDTGIEVIPLRLLVALVIGIFGIAISSLVALLLSG